MDLSRENSKTRYQFFGLLNRCPTRPPKLKLLYGYCHSGPVKIPFFSLVVGSRRNFETNDETDNFPLFSIQFSWVFRKENSCRTMLSITKYSKYLIIIGRAREHRYTHTHARTHVFHQIGSQVYTEQSSNSTSSGNNGNNGFMKNQLFAQKNTVFACSIREFVCARACAIVYVLTSTL